MDKISFLKEFFWFVIFPMILIGTFLMTYVMIRGEDLLYSNGEEENDIKE